MMVCVFWTPPKHEIRYQYLHIGSRYERYVLMIASCLVFFLKISLVSICFYVCFVVAVFIVYGIESQGPKILRVVVETLRLWSHHLRRT